MDELIEQTFSWNIGRVKQLVKLYEGSAKGGDAVPQTPRTYFGQRSSYFMLPRKTYYEVLPQKGCQKRTHRN